MRFWFRPRPDDDDGCCSLVHDDPADDLDTLARLVAQAKQQHPAGKARDRDRKETRMGTVKISNTGQRSWPDIDGHDITAAIRGAEYDSDGPRVTLHLIVDPTHNSDGPRVTLHLIVDPTHIDADRTGVVIPAPLRAALIDLGWIPPQDQT